MNTRIFRMFDTLSVWPRIFLNAVATSFPFYFAAFLSASVAKAYKATGLHVLMIHCIVFSGLILIVSFVYRILCFYYQAYKEDVEEEHRALFHAFALCDRTVIKQHRVIRESFSEPSQKLVDLIGNLDRIQEIVDDAYSTFESIYGNQEISGERIDFEVTFMTRSYEDNHITIPCCANRSGRKPRSLVLRKHKVEIYNNTETARLYRADRPNPIIISDTSVPEYSELYGGQKERIKSSIIFPVLCEDNVLLGALVVHCDQSNFFNIEKEKFWSDLLEVFAKRISVEKMKLDKLQEISRGSAIQLSIEHSVLF